MVFEAIFLFNFVLDTFEVAAVEVAEVATDVDILAIIPSLISLHMMDSY